MSRKAVSTHKPTSDLEEVDACVRVLASLLGEAAAAELRGEINSQQDATDDVHKKK
ncbi:hypothetical protein [Palleronia sp. THAF1]|uniref:hypothetical protein n=1 Tax=Palleronia sp. THAF1 TaxID=2587842 RepID=UPI001562790C|nr:hypothetical protein [Palleronia sp. THAF1]